MSPAESFELLAPVWLLVIGCVFAAVYQEFRELLDWARKRSELEQLWAEESFAEPADERDVSCA